jgi:hypothetical protein
LRSLLLIWCLLFSFCSLSGQNVRFYAATDASVSDPSNREYQVIANSIFEVSFTIENGQGTGFKSPDFGGLQVVQGPATSQQVSIINGRKSEKRSYTYSITGSNTGKYTIGSATITVNGKEMKTRPFNIVVIKGRESIDDQKETLILAQVSDSTAYLGQQIILQYRLVTQENIKSYEPVSNFEFEGFFVQELDDISRRTERMIINGEEYYSTVLEAVSLFPQQTGTYTIPSVAIRVGIPRASRRRSLFSFQEYDYKIVNSEAVTIKVEELPEGAPSSFSGAVGNYTASFKIDRRTLSTDQTLTMRVNIRGDGDSKHIIPPAMDLGVDFEVYEPNTVKDDSYIAGGEVVHYKEFEYLIVPRNEGRKTFMPEFTYFNVDSNDYVSINPDRPFSITVTPGSHIGLNVDAVNDRNLQPNKPSSLKTGKNWGFAGSMAHISLISLAFLGILGMTTHQFMKRRDELLDPAIKARRAAHKRAVAQMKEVKVFLDQQDERGFYNEISRTLLHYLEDKLNISTGSLTRDNLVEELSQNGITSNAIEGVSEILKHAEVSLFAGGKAGNLQNMYDRTLNIIEDIEANN